MSNNFLLHVKSSIDKTMLDMVTTLQATYPTLKGVEIDNLVQTDEMMKSEEPVLLWQFLALIPTPRDPLYRIEFMLGVKTVADSGNYLLAALMNEIGKVFEVGHTIPIGDYSGAVAVLDTGYMMVSRNTMTPQQYDHMSGMRFFTIIAHGVRNP